MSQGFKKQSLSLGGITLVLFTGSFDQVIDAFGAQVTDMSKAILVSVDTQSQDGNTTLLTIDNEWRGNVDEAKQAVLARGELNKYFGEGQKPIAFIASLGKDERYASAGNGFQRAKLGHDQMLRKLGATVFDQDGYVKGAIGGLTTLILYTKSDTPRADFAWEGQHFRQVTHEFGRENVRHTVIGQKAVMIAKEGTNQALIATSRDIKAMLVKGDGQAFRNPIEIQGKITELALAQKNADGTYTVLATTEKQIVPLTVTFDTDGTPKVFENKAQAIDVDQNIRQLGGVIKTTGSHAIFVGQQGLTYAPINGFRADAQQLFRGQFDTGTGASAK